MLESYYESLAYGDLGEKLEVKKINEEKYIEVPAGSFRRCALELSEMVSDDEGQEHLARRISASFCAMKYINEPRYLPGDEESRAWKVEFEAGKYSV